MSANKQKKRLAILVSGSGTNMQAILDSIDSGQINGEVVCVISSNHEAFALCRAREKNIPTFICSLKDFSSKDERDKRIKEILKSLAPDYVILAGYLGIITEHILDGFENRIINIHPALLPAYGGKSYYGLNVHKAVIADKEPFSGATAHFVDSGIDTGLIIRQEKLRVESTDTAESLQKKILENIEHKLLVSVVKDLCENKIFVENNTVIFKES